MKGYVLLITKNELEHTIYNTLYKKDNVDYIYPLFGEYDLICRVEAESLEDLGKYIEESIKTIPGIICTKTLMGY